MKTENKIINKIDEAILKSSQDDISFWDSYLTDNGYNLSEVNTIVEKNFKKHSFLINGLINREKDKIRLEKVAIMLKDSFIKHSEKPINYFMGLIKNNQLAIQYRNLDKLDINEIMQIIRDQDLLDALENFEDE